MLEYLLRDAVFVIRPADIFGAILLVVFTLLLLAALVVTKFIEWRERRAKSNKKSKE